MRPATHRLLLLLLPLVVACAPEPSQTLELEQAGLGMQLPGAWQLQRAEGQTLLLARPLEDGKPVAGAYLLLSRHPQRQGVGELRAFTAFMEEQALRHALDYRLLSSRTERVADVPARRLLRRWQGHRRERMELALLWVAQGAGYQLTGAAGPREFARLRPRFERALRSLRALDEPPR